MMLGRADAQRSAEPRARRHDVEYDQRDCSAFGRKSRQRLGSMPHSHHQAIGAMSRTGTGGCALHALIQIEHG